MNKLVAYAQAAAMGLPILLAASAAQAQSPAMGERDNSFNPSIGIVFNGMFSDYSEEEAPELPGFQLGHESERPDEGLALGHSEITMSGNIDDKFRGGLTLGLGVHADEPTEVELEEAYIQTLPGAGLPAGTRIKAGRALWTFGYLNELHAHADDFVDRPLPYRAFLDGAYNDDGVELSIVLPGSIYGEIGGGLFRGDDTPFGGSEDGQSAWSAFARFGTDLGRNSAFRIGAYMLDGEARGRTVGDAHAHEQGGGHGHATASPAELFSEGAFTGDTQLIGVDLRFTWAPTGNARNSELILQGEYFRRSEEGSYALEEEEECELEMPSSTEVVCGPRPVPGSPSTLMGDSSGWYAQAVYKFLPRWRAGVRYARLSPPDAAELDHKPSSVSAMLDWTNSEFGRIRLQHSEDSFGGEKDRQFMLQYVMSLGAHAAHSF